jgi:ATP adenylyltransferase/5',5'''-P-1,P-4-tetraphosphate phosphorylase II
MYSCTKEAGCSRYHKHMQLIQKPEFVETMGPGRTGFSFFPDLEQGRVKVPYVYFLHRFESGYDNQEVTAEQIYEVYAQFLSRCRGALGIPETDVDTLCPHNVIIVKDWITVIPRRKGSFKGIGANGAGMMGNPTVASRGLLEIWLESGPVNILQELGVPANQ